MSESLLLLNAKMLHDHSFKLSLFIMTLLVFCSVQGNKLRAKVDIKSPSQIDFTFSDYKYQYNIDKALNTCDAQVNEIISYSFATPSSQLFHMLYPKKSELTNFGASSETAGVSITKFEYYLENLKNPRFSNLPFQQGSYSQRWILITYLFQPVSSININYNYNIKRAILIDNDNQYNSIQSYFLNPYPFPIRNINFTYNLINMDHFDPNDIILPSQAKITQLQEGNYSVELSSSLNQYEEFSLSMMLPLEIASCDAALSQYINWSLLILLGLCSLLAIVAGVFVTKEN